jgi:hypothetical protein
MTSGRAREWLRIGSMRQLHGLLLAMLGLGCGGLLLALPRNIDSGKRIEAASRSEAGLKRAVHDFGNVLNDSKPLRYVFRFNNK